MVLITYTPQLETEMDRLGLSEGEREEFYAMAERMNRSMNRKLGAVENRRRWSIERMEARARKGARTADLIPADERAILSRAVEVVRSGVHLIPGLSGDWDVRMQALASLRISTTLKPVPPNERAVLFGTVVAMFYMGLSGKAIGRIAAAQSVLAGGRRTACNSIVCGAITWSSRPEYREFFDFVKNNTDIAVKR